jgi:hypothetical protein
MNQMEIKYIEYLQDVLISLHVNLHETEERKAFAEPEELNYIEGRLAAFREMLAILSQSADEFGIPKAEIGFS